MGMWVRRGAQPRLTSPRLLAGFLVAATLVFGCGKAAAVFFDLPQESEEERAQREARRARASRDTAALRQLEAAFAQDTLRQPPAIEGTLDPDSVVALLPQDAAGNIDWVAALRDDVVRPRTALPGSPPVQPLTGFRFDFRYEGGFNASFPHSAHVQWLSCDGCHLEIFRYRGERPTMEAINNGEKCGRCHGKVAFPTSTCERCHQAMSMPEGRMQPELLGDIVFRRPDDTAAAGGFPPARFQHWVHRIRYRCMACHPGQFRLRSGEAPIKMSDMQGGRSCGACHDSRTAFGLTECNRCHVPVAAPGTDSVR